MKRSRARVASSANCDKCDGISDYRADRMCDAQILDVLVFEPKRLADKLREELNSFVAAYRELEAEEDEE